jgi:hypothetical protein
MGEASGISRDALAVLAFAWTMLAALLAFVWKASATATSHDLRLKAVETTQGEHDSSFKEVLKELREVNKTIAKLDKRMAVNDAIDSAREGRRPSAPGYDTTP